jgi:3-oxoacyl-[acyl-carrier-protein] synthase II
MTTDRVVITGLGVVSPIGNDRTAFWESCMQGRSGAVRLDTPWVKETDLSTKIACPVRDFDPIAAGVPKKQVSLLDRTAWYAVAAADEALRDAGFEFESSERSRVSVAVKNVDPARMCSIIGSGIGGLNTMETTHALWRKARSKSGVKRYSLAMLIPNAPAGQVAIRFGARGECKTLSTACATGTMSLGDAWRLLAHGEADVALAGGAEGVATDEDSYGLMGFDRLRTMSQRNDDPERASRPFDKERDGFVLAEGAAVLVLEREKHARARGAKPYAVIASYSANCDAASMMQLDETGERIVSLTRTALDRAGLAASDVDHINAHGTSTVLNDKTESLAFRKLLGPRFDDVTVTALKSMTGHAIAASGALETVALAMSYREGVLTPTINYEFPDPDCDVNLVANEPKKADPGVALKLSYGFGGHNACLVLTPV